MKKSIVATIIMLLVIVPLHSQEKKGESKKTEVKKSGKAGEKKQQKLGAYIYFEETLENFEIQGTAALFDLDLDIIFNCKKSDIKFTELQKFPEVPFEISVITDKHTYADSILKIISNSNQKYIKETKVLSIYEGAPIPEGKKSVSIKTTFAAKDKTLSPEEIEKFQNKVIEDLNKKGYNLR